MASDLSNRFIIKGFLGLLGLFVLIFFVYGCSDREDTEISASPLTGANKIYKIYCINNQETKLVDEKYETETTDDAAKLIDELIERLRSAPAEITYKQAIPDDVAVNSWEIKDGLLTVDFSDSYNALIGVSEVLRRACVVKTLSQADGVLSVQYTVGGQPLMYSEINPVGAMSADDFIDNTDGETTYYQTVQVALYYTDAKGEKLFQTRHNVEFDGTISLEELVIRQLIDGPLETDALAPVIPERTKINKVSYKDGICYVDLNEEFLDGRDGVSNKVIVYSLVNSLVEIGSVTKVQFSIDGKIIASYRESVPIDLPIERNLEIIENTDN